MPAMNAAENLSIVSFGQDGTVLENIPGSKFIAALFHAFLSSLFGVPPNIYGVPKMQFNWDQQTLYPPP